MRSWNIFIPINRAGVAQSTEISVDRVGPVLIWTHREFLLEFLSQPGQPGQPCSYEEAPNVETDKLPIILLFTVYLWLCCHNAFFFFLVVAQPHWENCVLPTILVKSIWYTLKICFVFIIAPRSMIKAALFPKLGPPPSPPYNVASRGTLWAYWPNIVWGEGGRNGEIVKKGQVYHYFWPGL